MPKVVGIFASSHSLDKALNELLTHHFHGAQFEILDMQITVGPPKARGVRAWLGHGGFLRDTMDRADGYSLLDGTIAGSTVGGLAGVIAGAALLPGPVALGVAGILAGGLVGYLFDLVVPEERPARSLQALGDHCTLLRVQCESPAEASAAEAILRSNQVRLVGNQA